MNWLATEDEAVHWIQRTWSQQKAWIIATAVLTVILSLASEHYQSYKAGKQHAQAVKFEQLVARSSKETTQQQAILLNDSESFFAQSHYQSWIKMVQAKVAMAQKKPQAAIKALKLMASQTEQPPLSALAQLRLARILLDQSHDQEALGYLQHIALEPFKTWSNLYQGIIYERLHDRNQAHTAYGRLLAAGIQQWLSPAVIAQIKLRYAMTGPLPEIIKPDAL